MHSRIPVDSTVIAAVTYSDEATLDVEFTSAPGTATSPCPHNSSMSSSPPTRRECSSTSASSPTIHARSSMGDPRGPPLSDHRWLQGLLGGATIARQLSPTAARGAA